MAIRPLRNDRQVHLYKRLLNHLLPCPADELLGYEHLQDLLEALEKMGIEHSDDPWSAKMFRGLREQVRALSLTELLGLLKRLYSSYDGMGAKTALFSSSPNKPEDGIATLDKLTRLLVRPQAMVNLEIQAFRVILDLILLQEQTGSWQHLVRGVKEGNTNANKVFQRLIIYGSMIGWMPRFIDYQSIRQGLMKNMAPYVLGMFPMADENAGTNRMARVPVPEDCVAVCNHAYSELVKKHESTSLGLHRLVSWFESYRSEFQEHSDRLWSEIRTNATRGLKPTGDLVKITVAPLAAGGYRYLELLPQQRFPETKARFWIVLPDNEHRITVEQTLNDSRLVSPFPSADAFSQSIDCIQKFMAIHCLWKITTGKLRERVRHTRTDSAEREREATNRARPQSVRPFFRWLPPDYEATRRALERAAQAFGYLPPEGKTFVQSDGLETYQLAEFREPTQPPTLLYSQEDLGYTED